MARTWLVLCCCLFLAAPVSAGPGDPLGDIIVGATTPAGEHIFVVNTDPVNDAWHGADAMLDDTGLIDDGSDATIAYFVEQEAQVQLFIVYDDGPGNPLDDIMSGSAYVAAGSQQYNRWGELEAHYGEGGLDLGLHADPVGLIDKGNTVA